MILGNGQLGSQSGQLGARPEAGAPVSGGVGQKPLILGQKPTLSTDVPNLGTGSVFG